MTSNVNNIESSPPPISAIRRIWNFIVRNHLPIGLLLAILIGSQWQEPEKFLSSLSIPINTIAIAIIFFLQGLKLETKEAKDALISWRASLYGLIFILIFSPLLSLLILMIEIQPKDLIIGIALFLTMPATISTGVIFTREAHGNSSLALLLCVGSTLIGMFILPFTIANLALKDAEIEFDTWDFLLNLLLSVLLPMTIGKIMREKFPNALHYIKKTNNFIKYLSSICLILLPFIQISKSGESIRQLSFESIILTLFLGFIIHVILLLNNYLVCYFGSNLLRIDYGKQKALILCCSGKTIAIAIAVLPMLDYQEEKKGLLAVSMVMAHLVQTIMDSCIAAWWKGKMPQHDIVNNGNNNNNHGQTELVHIDNHQINVNNHSINDNSNNNNSDEISSTNYSILSSKLNDFDNESKHDDRALLHSNSSILSDSDTLEIKSPS